MPETFKISGEQSAAVKSFGADLAVSAGAGSGKTTVLVERYLEAVTGKGSLPENILAVTFTDKAANVMKERLRRRCDELALYEVRRRLDGAWIGTIHSFCKRFLKENPIECGVDPLFTVLGAGEQEILMEEVLDRLFEEEASSELCVKLLADHGEDAVRYGIRQFYDKHRSYAGDSGLLRVETMEARLAEAEKTLIEACKKSSLGAGASLSGPEEKLREVCRRVLETFRGPLEGWPARRQVLSAVDSLDRRSSKTKEKVDDLKRLAKTWGALRVQALAEPLKQEWCRLLGVFSKAYETQKRRNGVHDFDDLLVFTYRALAGTSVEQKALRRRIQEQFSAIFVDEYQDVSALQAKIIELVKRDNNLFVVGDTRQSIYGFRHAHPEIFLEALKRSEPLSLAENYRTRPEILDLVNRVFKELFGASHEALIPKRNFVLKKEHCVEWIAVPPEERTLDASRVIEARTIASRIRQMVDSGFLVEGRGGPRPVRWRDFAILVRKTTASRFYEKELEAFSIPYFVNKGRGFFEKIEVADLINFLRVLENPSEDLPMAAVLRSPLVQLSDDALYWLTKKRFSSAPETTLAAALSRHTEITEIAEDDHRRIGEFLPLLNRLRQQKDRRKLSELLHTIVDETAYEAKALTRPDGRQASANIWKLIELASEVEDKNIRGISDLILYLKSVSNSSETEAEARIMGEEEDVLRILTVHAAKGLEFPCVVLADLGAQNASPGRPPFLCSISEGVGARVKDPEDLQTCEDASYSAILEEYKKKEAEEMDRLLYVAMTRPKEHLILSGGGSRMQFLELALTQGETSFYRVPVVLRRPSRPDEASCLADRLPGQAAGPLLERLEQQIAPVTKKYEALEDLTVSQLVETVSSAAALDPVPEAGDEDGADEEGEDEATPRNEFGTMFHFMMEISARQLPRGQLSRERMDELTASLTPQESMEIANSFKHFWESPTGKGVKRSPQCYPELPFIYKTRHGILKGQIDLVFREAGGGWVILDYKTNRFANDAEKKTAVSVYRWQLGLYALAFWKLYGEIPKKTILWFTASREATEVLWQKKELEALTDELEERYRSASAVCFA